MAYLSRTPYFIIVQQWVASTWRGEARSMYVICIAVFVGEGKGHIPIPRQPADKLYYMTENAQSYSS